MVLLHAAHADEHHDEADFSEGKSSGVASDCEALFAIIVDLTECDGKTDDGNKGDGLDDGVTADLLLDLLLFGQCLNLLLRSWHSGSSPVKQEPKVIVQSGEEQHTEKLGVHEHVQVMIVRVVVEYLELIAVVDSLDDEGHHWQQDAER